MQIDDIRQRLRDLGAGPLHEQAMESVLLPRAPRIDPADLVAAGERYARAAGYPIQYQWTLLEGINDSDQELAGIVSLLAGQYAVMNFIPFNAGPLKRGWIRWPVSAITPAPINGPSIASPTSATTWGG